MKTARLHATAGRSYGRKIVLADLSTVEVSGCASIEEATERAVFQARKLGWRPRRWWEIWKPKCDRVVKSEFERQEINLIRGRAEMRKKKARALFSPRVVVTKGEAGKRRGTGRHGRL